MIVRSTADETWGTNTYLLADRAGGHGILVDPNGAVQPLVEQARRLELTLTHLVITHEHEDHVVGVAELAQALGLPLAAHPVAAGSLSDVEQLISPGDELCSGLLRWRILGLPGHAAGQVGLYEGSHCVTGDALFAGSIGGQREPSPTAFDEVRTSVETLLALPPATTLLPGHGPATTVADEREGNPFVRIWLGLEPEGSQPCRVGGPYGWEARLILSAADYDGGTKAWVRFPRAGDCILPGSWVRLLEDPSPAPDRPGTEADPS